MAESGRDTLGHMSDPGTDHGTEPSTDHGTDHGTEPSTRPSAVHIRVIVGKPGLDGHDRGAKVVARALRDAGIAEAPELLVQGLFTYRSGLDAAEQLIDLADPPSAIFASNDDMAAATVAIAHRRGLDVPGDLTVCGFDDTALATTIWPELTTIRQPVFDMSRTAVDLLVREVRARNAEARPTREPHMQAKFELIRRQSDAAPRRRPSAHKG